MKRIGLIGAMLVTGAAYAASGDGLTVSGHVDAGYIWVKDNANTFGLNQGSVMVHKTLGMGEGVLDLFVTPKQGSTSGFDVGVSSKSQAYVAWKYENGFNWKLGQWNSLYGYEGAHSYDYRFTNRGPLSALTPDSHLGLYLGYDFSDMLGLGLFVANPSDDSTMTQGNPDFGFKVGAKTDAFWAQVAGLFTRDHANKGWLFDVTGGTKVAGLGIDLDVLFGKPGSGADTGFAIGGILGYGISDLLGVGTRFEWIKNGGELAAVTGTSPTDLANAHGIDEGFAWTVGPQAHVSNDLTLKLDYTLLKPKSVDAIHEIALAGVYKF